MAAASRLRRRAAPSTSTSSTRVAACGQEPGPNGAGVIALWDAETGEEIQRLRGHTWSVRWVAFRHDGKALASCGFDGEIRVWNLTTGECVKTFNEVNTFVERVHFLPG